MTNFKLVARVAFLSLAMSLAACGGGGGVGSANSGGVSVVPITDSFIAAILALIRTSPDNTEPADISAIATTSSDNTEPAANTF